jgi:hypothetical protein
MKSGGRQGCSDILQEVINLSAAKYSVADPGIGDMELMSKLEQFMPMAASGRRLPTGGISRTRRYRPWLIFGICRYAKMTTLSKSA